MGIHGVYRRSIARYDYYVCPPGDILHPRDTVYLLHACNEIYTHHEKPKMTAEQFEDTLSATWHIWRGSNTK